MRLWHKDLIKVLPDKQLIGQWRECCAIATNIKNDGTPNHLLVNKIMNYHLSHFYKFCVIVANEMYARNFTISCNSIDKIMTITDVDARVGIEFITNDELFKGWHDDRYMIQCYYNLQEKHDCGGISENEWNKISDMYNNYFL